MPELLIEIFSEEIPARMQARAEADLKQAVLDGLKAAGVAGTEVASMSGPRRLTVVARGLPEKSDDVREERKGPKTGAPDKAIAGFLRGAGLSSIDDAEIRSDPKKGAYYVAVIEKPGRRTSDILAELVPEIIRGFHWPKSMRWGTGDLRWVRPIQRILCVFDGKVVPFEIAGVKSGDVTEGHRVHGRGPFTVRSLDDYVSQLGGEGHVLLTRADRRALIEKDARALCNKAGLELVEDEGLLEEVTGLVEWPVVVMGDMDPDFLTLPPEVIRLSMRTHQKYFSVRDPKTGALAPKFITVANIEATDGGRTIAAGNAKVLIARLDDARFFWDNDRRTSLEEMAAKLGTIAFKQGLGSIGDKVERVAALARELAPKVGADPDLAERAARLAKADLVSDMVQEFPELQGVMGRYYALSQSVIPDERSDDPGSSGKPGQHADKTPDNASGTSGVTPVLAGLSRGDIEQVANAIRDHYRPQGPSDAVPSEPVSIAVALADKLDTLVGFWAIGEKPTGSKDPFALRRAALGVVRIVLENGVRLGLSQTLLDWTVKLCGTAWISLEGEYPDDTPALMRLGDVSLSDEGRGQLHLSGYAIEHTKNSLLTFFADRLKQYLRDKGARHDLIDAVFALGTPPQGGKGDRPPADEAAPAQASAEQTAVSAGNDDLVLITKRVEALGAFLDTDDGANLLAGYKRAANILRAEEKKDGRPFGGNPDPEKFDTDEERNLHRAIVNADKAVDAALPDERFEDAMTALSSLRSPLDALFDEEIKINADDRAVRENRLLLLARMRAAMHRVADFSRIEG